MVHKKKPRLAKGDGYNGNRLHGSQKVVKSLSFINNQRRILAQMLPTVVSGTSTYFIILSALEAKFREVLK